MPVNLACLSLNFRLNRVGKGAEGHNLWYTGL